ncbi:MAG: hypothetical protein AAB229_05070 [Candidatus Hydrogenedentota bacterium]
MYIRSAFPASCVRLFGIVLLLASAGMPVFAADPTITVDFEDLRDPGVPELSGDTGDMVESAIGRDSLISLADFYSRTPGSSIFGTWELHGDVRRRGTALFGEQMRCRLGGDTFYAAAWIVMDTNSEGTRVTSFDLLGDSMSVTSFIPKNLGPIRNLFNEMPMGTGRAVLVGSRDANNDSRVHYFFANWVSTGGTFSNDTNTLPGMILKNMIAQMPGPYRQDIKVSEYQLTGFNIRFRYWPIFYQQSSADKLFGANSRRDEMVMSLDAVVTVPHRFLMLNTPHRYSVSLKNVPLRLFVERKLKN